MSRLVLSLVLAHVRRAPVRFAVTVGLLAAVGVLVVLGGTSPANGAALAGTVGWAATAAAVDDRRRVGGVAAANGGDRTLPLFESAVRGAVTGVLAAAAFLVAGSSAAGSTTCSRASRSASRFEAWRLPWPVTSLCWPPPSCAAGGRRRPLTRPTGSICSRRDYAVPPLVRASTSSAWSSSSSVRRPRSRTMSRIERPVRTLSLITLAASS